MTCLTLDKLGEDTDTKWRSCS